MAFDQIPVLRTISSNKHIRAWLWIALAALFLGCFVVVTSEMQEAATGKPELLGSIDRLPEQLLAGARTHRLNDVAVSITALGSVTVVAIFVAIATMLLLLKRHFHSAIHLMTAAAGSAALTFILKSFFERPRPNGLRHLVDVQGYSYPSGHSLSSAAIYFTFAVLLCNSFQKWSERLIVVSTAVLMICLIGFTRIYLGVHYVSDVMAGILIGIGWAALLGALRAYIEAGRSVYDQ